MHVILRLCRRIFAAKPQYATFGRKILRCAQDDTKVYCSPHDLPMKKIFLAFIRFYQKHISPCTPPACRFRPTCSAYAYEAINKYGAVKGGWLALKRLLRCNPFYKGDFYDPVP